MTGASHRDKIQPPMTEAISKSAISKPSITIRDLESIDDMRLVPAVEQAVWAGDDRDIVPVLLLIAAKEAGSILIGAFDEHRLIGFVFGFPGLEHGEISIHSHMLAVLPHYRDLNLGYQLKLAQRERSLAMNIRLITWTFDPLQARNAHFNFAKLGVVSDRYKIDFYGRESTSTLHQNGTDRLWVSWFLASDRARARLKPTGASPDMQEPHMLLLRCDERGRPVCGDLGSALAAASVGIQIPSEIGVIEERGSGLAVDWRQATRGAFTECLNSGFYVADFLRGSLSQSPGTYVLKKGTIGP
jgi:predicted GNAT superfamily acetyltransferase